MTPPAERWVVFGIDKYGERFEWPDETQGDYGSTREQAEDTVRRMNRRGGNVSMRREVWDAPAAAYRRPRGELP